MWMTYHQYFCTVLFLIYNILEELWNFFLLCTFTAILTLSGDMTTSNDFDFFYLRVEIYKKQFHNGHFKLLYL